MKTRREWINNIKGASAATSRQPADAQIPRHGQVRVVGGGLGPSRPERAARHRDERRSSTGFGRERGLKMFADWTDRIAAGEVPPAPPRPAASSATSSSPCGTGPTSTRSCTTRSRPTSATRALNADGPIYGVDSARQRLSCRRSGRTHVRRSAQDSDARRSGDDALELRRRKIPSRLATSASKPVVGRTRPIPHNPMMDAKGRVWITSPIRDRQNPAWCKDGVGQQVRAVLPARTVGRQARLLRPEDRAVHADRHLLRTHHLQFAEDANDTLYFSGGGARRSAGSTRRCTTQTGTSRPRRAGARRCSTPTATARSPSRGTSRRGTGRGRRRRRKPAKFDPKLDTRVPIGDSTASSPIRSTTRSGASTDDVSRASFPASSRGNNPPQTCITRARTTVPKELGYRTRGIDVDRNGVIWTALAGSSQLASFDRTQVQGAERPAHARRPALQGRLDVLSACRARRSRARRSAPTSTITTGSISSTRSGLGENMPIANGSSSDSLLAFMPDNEAVGDDARPVSRWASTAAGWTAASTIRTPVGRAAGSTRPMAPTPLAHRGRPREPGNLVKFQIRPDPLAR